ncbi:VOC family protein [Microbacteriaceae bacterium VKM Ac-2854]|nr:VOC family protein [Microbacteriaceae bacterium VKM Ac-2854]
MVAFAQVNVIVADMSATLAFYRRLGLTVELPMPSHASAVTADGVRLEFDTVESEATWSAAAIAPAAGGTVLGFALDDRAAVDAAFADLVAEGARALTVPYDAFWGSRYAIVADPDGNPVALMSPADPTFENWPPQVPPMVRTPDE